MPSDVEATLAKHLGPNGLLVDKVLLETLVFSGAGLTRKN